jgi:uncharacterized membrane protein YsdA (DUF1294 family)
LTHGLAKVRASNVNAHVSFSEATSFAGVNAGAAATFWYDKECAKQKQWRVSENALCMTALAGGWIGGM